jgi:hypothetical protein
MRDRTLMTGDEAIRYLGLDRCGLADPREALRWLRRTGRLRSARIGRRIFYRRAWLDAVVDGEPGRPAR